MYVPPYQALLNRFAKGSNGEGQDQHVVVPLSLFRLLLQFAVSAMDFDEEGYFRANPDVAAALRDLPADAAFDHYIGYGYFEGRRGAVEFDEAWYRATYPDVDAAVGAGQLKSAADHYYQIGGAEGRGPNPAQAENAARWKIALLGPR